MTAREAAARSVIRAFKDGRFANLELDGTLAKTAFSDADKRFYTRLFYGTVERKITLDHLLSRLSETPVAGLDGEVLAVLETGLYQLFYMDKVPASAACNETVTVAKKLCRKRSAAGFVNAVMREAVRRKDALTGEIAAAKGLAGVSLRTSLPVWLLELWEKDYGCAEDIANGFLRRGDAFSVHVNTMKTSADELLAAFGEASGAVKVSESVIALGGSVNVRDLPGYGEGLFYVQDESGALAASLISPESVGSGEPFIIDTCACPGGKTFAMAIAFGDGAKILSLDLHENRLPLIRKGAARLGLHNVETAACDARKPLAAYFGLADAVLCDVPCSGLGIVAKKPDIRFKTPADIERLPAVQRAILDASSAYVKDGGLLVYATCTLRREENDGVVDGFLAAHPAFTSEALPFAGGESGKKTFLPQVDGTDGFFCAKLRKKASGKGEKA